ncbi:PaaI family thioesterase [uncultured Jatrophihabitans sp.]|uniref:PaaI family thioesterase n=1 Tax=uncultured Jatrophihabitans sp. TaxID=1610747 RepID=UPI0035C95388
MTERPFDPLSDTRRGGTEYDALHAAHRLLNDRLAGAAMPADVERDVAARLDELNELLRSHQAPREHDRVDGMRPDLPGRGHPLLPPFVIDGETIGEHGTGTLRGRVTFGRFYLGGGAAVHGGVHPLLFDDVLGRVANQGKPFVARTASLKVDYHRVTLLDVELFWDVTLERTDGRKRFTTGRLTDADGNLLVEAQALFVELLPGMP